MEENKPAVPTLEEVQFRETVDLKDPALAALLAWLVPGLGHLYQGRTAKAALFFVCIMGTFLTGSYFGSDRDLGWARVVYCSWRKGDKRLPYLCQVGVGLPATPAMVQSLRASRGLEVWGEFMAPPPLAADRRIDGRPTLNTINKKLGRYWELGTVYTMIAGLLNILAMYDAWGGPVFGETTRKKDQENEDEDQEDESPEEAS